MQGCSHDRLVSPDATVPRLRPIHDMLLPAGEGGPQRGVTLVTHCSLDRLPALAAQARCWHGPLVAAVAAFDGKAGVSVARRIACERLRAFKLQLVGCSCTVVRIVMFSVSSSELYPINSLRNRALALARTELVLPLDVDLLPSASARCLHDAGQFEALRRKCCEGQCVIVVPAFESSVDAEGGEGDAEALAGSSKQLLCSLLAAGDVRAFASAVWPPGHGATDSSRWATTDLMLYEV